MNLRVGSGNHGEQTGKIMNQFEKYVPHLSILINCMYWDERYPKLITKEQFADALNSGFELVRYNSIYGKGELVK